MEIDCTYKGSLVKIINVQANGRDTYVTYVSGAPSGMYRDIVVTPPTSASVPVSIATNVTQILN